MVRYFILWCVIVAAFPARAQQARGESNVFTLSSDTSMIVVAAEVERPPVGFEVGFSEPSGNGVLDAGETGVVEVTIRNRGKVEAKSVSVNLYFLSDSTGLTSDPVLPAEVISPGGETTAAIHIRADIAVTSRTVRVGVSLKELNGLRCDPPAELEFNTKARE